MIADCALYSDGRRRHRLDDLRVALREAEKDDGFVWIGLVEPTADEFAAIAEGFELPQLAIDDAIRAHQRPKLERYGNVTFAVVKPVHYVDHVEVVEVSELAVFLGDRFVIVVRHGDTEIPAQVRAALEVDRDMLLHGPPAVLHAILDKSVDQYLDVSRAIDVDLDEIEDQVFGDDPGSDHAKRIYKLKREVQQFRRAVVPLVQPLTRLAEDDVPWIPAYARPYFRDVQDHALRAAEQIEAADALLTNVMQADLAQVTVEQNRVTVQQNADMRKISAWAAIALVPTAIAGLYGMNFDQLPAMHSPAGFWVVLAGIGVVCVALHRAFRRNHWL
ncbi:magnesium and cobalt transport protein CorA [Cellulomonas fengjieae]|uniref:Magnesium and cobalt transport protein CorA n=1 Tax=Cellulomonas fengjieae TaxID=2819978 RepID=A0ABS3SHV7_9CELL|nr:magnesium and cobalt transport protein CorA [Cellulomonas fengjieae]MBO3085327.1 magnesium and cobalt transport protein CorA [Cellulomonas fengjieae]MBO3101073.1 magnesium and cobalt transport protein CorA [Cellulomonas fengjieae]QVI66117.1 magnesium and cobalt transport protein CorA [Cellulomonas fengjieae]